MDILAAGKIGGFFSDNVLDDVVTVMKKLDITHPKAGGWCHGLDKHNKAYPWFSKTILQPLRNQFHPRLDLIYGMLLHSTHPFAVHADHFETPKQGQQYKSFLIPLNVDGDPKLCCNSKTIIFDQTDKLNVISPNPTSEHLPLISPEASALSIYDVDLTHIPKDTARVLSVKMSATWHNGDLIFWDSLLLHTSSDFKAKGYLFKECIVVHTYIPQ